MLQSKKSTDREFLSFKQSLLEFGRLKLTPKQRSVLFFIEKQGLKESTTQTVIKLSNQMSCAPSTLWDIIRSLKSLKLLRCSFQNSKGGKLRLSISGEFIAKELDKNES